MIRLEARREPSRMLTLATPLIALVAAASVGAVIVALTRRSVAETYSSLADRGFGGLDHIEEAFVTASPLLLCGLAVAVAFRAGLYNLGAQGQMVMGAVAASGVAIWAGPSIGGASVGLMVVAGAAAGTMWAAIPGVLRVRFNASEALTSLMLNFVAYHLSTYLISESVAPWRDASGNGAQVAHGSAIPTAAEWTPLDLGGVDVPQGLVIGTIAAVILTFVASRTRFGFASALFGDSPSAAVAVGVPTRRLSVAILALSGALAGLAGSADVGDSRHLLDPVGLDRSASGYTAIAVAVLARLNPLAVPVVAVAFGGIANAGRALEGTDLPVGLVGTLQGLVLLFAVGAEFLVRYRVRRAGPTRPPQIAPAVGVPE